MTFTPPLAIESPPSDGTPTARSPKPSPLKSDSSPAPPPAGAAGSCASAAAPYNGTSSTQHSPTERVLPMRTPLPAARRRSPAMYDRVDGIAGSDEVGEH